MTRIVVEVPESDARRDQIERRVFDQLAAVRIADRVDAAVAPPRRRWPIWVAAGSLAAAIAFVLVRGTAETTVALPSSPSLVQTPAGGSSRFTVGDSVIDAGPDTSVKVQQEAAGGVTLVLARGSVDCDVEPRTGRSPFRVVAGDVTVTVVGTRFTVRRSGDVVRVDVARGKIRVTSPTGEHFVAAGDVWTSGGAITATATPAPVAPSIAVAPPAPEPIEKPAPNRQTEYQSAQRLEARDRAAAGRAYRVIANGSDRWAALALISLVQLQQGSPVVALGILDEYQRRFPRGVNAEDAAWLRVQMLTAAGRRGDVGPAARAYLDAFPSGTYATMARRLADAR